MSRRTLVLARIICDTDGCAATYPADDWATDMSIAWTQARREGWERDYEQDRCPEHAPSTPLIASIRELAAKGLPDRRIGEQLGLSRGGVQSLRYKHGITGQRAGRPNTKGSNR